MVINRSVILSARFFFLLVGVVMVVVLYVGLLNWRKNIRLHLNNRVRKLITMDRQCDGRQPAHSLLRNGEDKVQTIHTLTFSGRGETIYLFNFFSGIGSFSLGEVLEWLQEKGNNMKYASEVCIKRIVSLVSYLDKDSTMLIRTQATKFLIWL